MRMRVSRRQSEDPGALGDLTSSRRPSLFSGSAPEGGCWASELSESGSASVTAAALGSDTSLRAEETVGVSGREKESSGYNQSV